MNAALTGNNMWCEVVMVPTMYGHTAATAANPTASANASAAALAANSVAANSFAYPSVAGVTGIPLNKENTPNGTRNRKKKTRKRSTPSRDEHSGQSSEDELTNSPVKSAHGLRAGTLPHPHSHIHPPQEDTHSLDYNLSSTLPRPRHIAREFLDESLTRKLAANAAANNMLDLDLASGVTDLYRPGGSGQGSDETSGIISDSDMSTLDRQMPPYGAPGGPGPERYISLDANDARIHHQAVVYMEDLENMQFRRAVHKYSTLPRGVPMPVNMSMTTSLNRPSRLVKPQPPPPVRGVSLVTANGSIHYQDPLPPPPLPEENDLELMLAQRGLDSDEERLRSPTSPRSALKGSRPMGTGSINKQLRFTTLNLLTVSVCVLACAAGVYCATTTAPTVRLTVFLPKRLLRTQFNEQSPLKRMEVFLNRTHKAPVNGRENFQVYKRKDAPETDSEKVWVFEVNNAEKIESRSTCQTQYRCPQSCERPAGADSAPQCVCARGYGSDKDKTMCSDKNECVRSGVCPSGMTCLNLAGHYQCLCGPGTTMQNGRCVGCGEPCEPGHYEWHCIPGQKRSCTKCKNLCAEGYFMYKKCTDKQDSDCRKCGPTCTSKQFESTPCLRDRRLNRNCLDKSLLPGMTSSYRGQRIVWEDLTRVNSRPRAYEVGPSDVNKTFVLDRGSGYKVHLQVQELNLAPVMVPVDHAKSNNNAHLLREPGNSNTTLTQLCPYPLALTYRLIARPLERQTSKAQMRQDIPGFLPSIQPCKTFKVFGKLDIDPKFGPVCAEPGLLTGLFGRQKENLLRNHTSLYVETIQDCDRTKTMCFQCLKKCSGTSAGPRDSSPRASSGGRRPGTTANPDCQVTAFESDDGWSPKLAKCYNCCAKDECTPLCNHYYTPNCHKFRCMEGTLFQYMLQPEMRRDLSNFHCHVELKPTTVYKLRYQLEEPSGLKSDPKLLQLKIGPKDSRSLGKERVDRFKDSEVLAVTYLTRVDELPEVIGGDQQSQKAYRWDRRGAVPVLSDEPVKGNSLEVWSKDPMGMTTDRWNRLACESAGQQLNQLYRTQRGTPIQALTDLSVDRGVRSFEYRVMRSSRAPSLSLQLDSARSVLADKGYMPSKVSRDGLRADLFLQQKKQGSAQWVVEVEGRSEWIPGRFRLQLWDPADGEPSPGRLLYHYDVGVSEEKGFLLQLPVPIEPVLPPNTYYNKTLMVRLLDAGGVVDLRVHRDSRAADTKTVRRFQSTARPRPDLFQQAKAATIASSGGALALPGLMFYSLIGVCGLLLLLLFLGHVTSSADSFQRSNALNWFHLMLFIVYTPMKAVYCACVTLTALLIVVNTYARPPPAFATNLQLFEKNVSVSQEMAIARMDRHMWKELERQQRLVIIAKDSCDKRMDLLWTEVEAVLEKLSRSSAGRRVQVQVSDAIAEHSRQLMETLRDDVAMFRQRFQQYAADAVLRMERKMRQSTAASLRNNRWLAAARVVYDMVRSKRGDRTRPFLPWLGVNPESAGNSDIMLQFSSIIPTPNISSFDIPNMREPDYQDFQKTEVRPPAQVLKTIRRGGAGKDGDDVQLLGKSSASGPQEDLAAKFVLGWYHLLICALVIDGLWMLHRVISSLDTVDNIIYGYTLYIDCTVSDKYITPSKRPASSCFHRLCSAMKHTFVATMESDLVSRFVASAVAVILLFVASSNLDTLVSVESVDGLGYYDNLLVPAEARLRLVNTQIVTNAERLNQLELGFAEKSADTRYRHYQQLVLSWQKWTQELEDKGCVELLKYKNSDSKVPQHCLKRRRLDTLTELGLTDFQGCRFDRIVPKIYDQYDSSAMFKDVVQISSPMIADWRQYISQLLFIFFCYVSILVLWNVLGETCWFYLKRCQILRQRRVYETSPAAETYPSNHK